MKFCKINYVNYAMTWGMKPSFMSAVIWYIWAENNKYVYLECWNYVHYFRLRTTLILFKWDCLLQV